MIRTIEFRGQLSPESFAEFVRHRAGRLALELTVIREGRAAAAYRVGGQPDLVDAFEMACSLGPADCLVLDVVDLTNSTENG